MKILFVEDHPGLAAITCRLLRDIYGHEVQYAATTQQALESAWAVVPDVALIDLNLPDGDGYHVARTLRADARYERTVLVALTGFDDLLDKTQAQAAGFDEFYRKPLDFEVLKGLKRA